MWNTFIYQPLYNTFFFILGSVPGSNIAAAVIILTILIKVILFPLYQKSIRSQQLLKKIQPQINELQKKYKDDRAELGKQTLEIYKKYNINPFTSILLIFIQLPILIALYFVFSSGIHSSGENLYSFIQKPEHINTLMFGFIEATKPFLPFAFIAGITQAIQARINFPKEDNVSKENNDPKEPSFQDEFAKSMRIQMIYVLPVFITILAIKFASAITLYWIVSNIFGILQELYVRKTIKTA